MATRTCVPGSGGTDDTAGQPFHASGVDKFPGGTLGWVAVTANQGSITGAVDLTGLTLTVTVNTTRLIRIAWSLQVDSGSASPGFFAILVLKDGSAIERKNYQTSISGATAMSGWCYDDSPSAGSHIYKLQGGRAGADANTWTLNAAAGNAAWLEVLDTGPHF